MAGLNVSRVTVGIERLPGKRTHSMIEKILRQWPWPWQA